MFRVLIGLLVLPMLLVGLAGCGGDEVKTQPKIAPNASKGTENAQTTQKMSNKSE